MQKIAPYVQPYRWWVVATLVLTLIGSLIAQVNAVVLDRTVDAINALVVPEGFEWSANAAVQRAVQEAESEVVARGGRILLRASGTEPVVRVMAEAPDAALAERTARAIADAMEAAAA